MYCPECGGPLACYEGEPYCPDCTRWGVEEEERQATADLAGDGSAAPAGRRKACPA
jgi:uncharacterized Zn finger protein (UPF0148 family)